MHGPASMLRVFTCGSVDDGKSTLIGRLLHDAGLVPDDELAALARDDQGRPDLSALVDGLAAEREQGITIDVAYRYFETPGRKYILADTPGHEQYTRNMITGASTADVAVVLADARKGVLIQTRRHTVLAVLAGVKRLILAVNKMDLAGWDRAVFDAIAGEYRVFAARLGAEAVTAIPVSALDGDNVVNQGAGSPWHDGPTLLEALEAAPQPDDSQGPFRLPVQSVVRAGQDFRGLAGMIAQGTVQPGDRIHVVPSGREGRVARVIGPDGDQPLGRPGASVMLTLDEPVDIGRGDILCAAEAPCAAADQFEADLAWMDDEPLLPGRSYWLKAGARTVAAQVTEIRHRLSVETLEQTAAKTLVLNDIGVVKLSLAEPIGFEPYAANRDLGGFILIDRKTNATAGAGMIRHALRRASNIHWQALSVDAAARAAIKSQRPACVWFTGLSGAGKSTIADLLEKRLHDQGRHTYLLDGDNVRHGLNRDLGFTDADRVENVRRVAEVARLMTDAGLIVLVSFISPFQAERAMARRLFAEGDFIEVFVDAPLDVAEARDPKGLYRKARAGQLPHFTGVDSAYEPPERPDVRIDTTSVSPEQAVEAILQVLSGRT